VQKVRDELLAQIYASPQSIDLRHVLADALLEMGDPWGEFMVLQLQAENGTLTSKQEARERNLFRTYSPMFLGAMGTLIRRATFRWGFPITAAVIATRTPGWLDILDRVEWATFEELHLIDFDEQSQTRFLSNPNLRSLRTLQVVHPVALPPLLEKLIIDRNADAPVLAALATLQLHHIVFARGVSVGHGDFWQWIKAHPRLDEVTISYGNWHEWLSLIMNKGLPVEALRVDDNYSTQMRVAEVSGQGLCIRLKRARGFDNLFFDRIMSIPLKGVFRFSLELGYGRLRGKEVDAMLETIAKLRGWLVESGVREVELPDREALVSRK
jgi:hypothetical protein